MIIQIAQKWKIPIQKIRTYNDGVSRSDVAPEVLTFLDEFVPNSSTERSVNYVGIVSVDGGLALFLPKGMEAHCEISKARRLYRCISQYERSIFLGWGVETKEEVSIPLGVDILEDYLANGLYIVRERKNQRASRGKVNWAKTISQLQPYLTKSNVPIYTPTITSKHVSSQDDILQIHRAIVREADEEFSWIISKTGSRIAPNLKNAKLNFSIGKAIKLLRSELSRQYEDNKVAQINLMINYLQQKNELGGKSDWRLGTTSFQVLWEQMCANVLGDQKKNFPPPAIPAYQCQGTTIVRSENAPKPDIVISKEKKLTVVDAKYYDFSKSRPAWGDMVKQFFYAKSFALKYPDFEIKNYFAVPKISDRSVDKVVVIDQNGRPMDTEFSPIKIIYLDVDEILDLFIKRKSSEDLRNSVL